VIPWLRRNAGLALGTIVLLSAVALDLVAKQGPPGGGRSVIALRFLAPSPTATSSPTAAPTFTLTATASATLPPTATHTQTSTPTRTSTATPAPTPTRPEERTLAVPVFLQELPLSCEFAGIRMVSAALLGASPDEEELVACMPRNPNPYLGFRGDPAGYSRLEDGTINWDNYGAYAPAVAESLNNCVLLPAGGEYEAQAHRDVTYQQVADSVLDGYPVIVWVTKRGEPARFVADTPDGPVPLIFGEHVWVVAGYHLDGTFEVHDPYPQKNGEQTLRVHSFPNWDLFDRMAVFLKPRTSDLEVDR